MDPEDKRLQLMPDPLNEICYNALFMTNAVSWNTHMNKDRV